MSERKSAAVRKAELIMACRQQRQALATEWQTVRTSLTPAGMGAGVLDAVGRHKWLVLGSALALAFLKPRRVIAGLEAGLVGMEMWRKLAPLFQSVREYFGKGNTTSA